jgi:elongation factor Tu
VVLKVGENVEIVGLKDTKSVYVLVLKCSKKTLDETVAGDNVGVYYVLKRKILNVVWY